MARKVRPGDFIKEVDAMMSKAVDDGNEKLWNEDFVVSFNGLECHMPFLADVYEYLSSFLESVKTNLEPDWITWEIETGYVPELDMTIITQDTYEGGHLVKEEIIGFYHGEPNDEDTKTYSHKGVVCKFESEA